MMEMVHVEEPSDEDRSLRLDRMCLRAVMGNYLANEFTESKPDSDYYGQDFDTNSTSTLRSWARFLWRIGSNVLFRSDPKRYSIQIIQLLSQYGSGWISINPSDISAQGSLWKSLSLLESHGLIRLDVGQRRIRIEGINLRKEIQEKFQFEQVCDLEIIQEFLRLLITPSDQFIPRPSLIGLTSTLRLVLNQPEFKLTQGFEPYFDTWVRGMLALAHLKRNNKLQDLNDGERQVMSAGIEMYEGISSFHFTTLEIHFLLRTALRSMQSKHEKKKGSDSGEESRAKDELDHLMSKAMTYITLLDITVGPIVLNQIPNPNQQFQAYFGQRPNPNYLNEKSLHRMLEDCMEVAEELRRFMSTLTPDLIGILEQLTSFFKSGWNVWKQLERSNKHPYGYGEDFGRVFLLGHLRCLNKQGKLNEISTLVKETKEFLNQLRPGDQFKPFFQQCLITFCFDTGMVHELTEFLEELEVFVMNKYGENRVGHTTTTILCFGDRVTAVTDGLLRLEQMGVMKKGNGDWSEFLEQVKRSVVKWTQLISTPSHVHERKSWMEVIANVVRRKCDLYIEGRK